MTVGEAAARLGVAPWRVVRLYLRGLLPEPERVGRVRVVTEAHLPAIRAALVRAGYLDEQLPLSENGDGNGDAEAASV
jgi:hypothetical protein